MRIRVYQKGTIAFIAVISLLGIWMFFSPLDNLPNDTDIFQGNQKQETVNEDAAKNAFFKLSSVAKTENKLIIRDNLPNDTDTFQGNQKQETVKEDSDSYDAAKNECRFNGTFQENLNKLASLQFPEVSKQMRDLGFDQDPAFSLRKLPAFVTGFNSAYFDVAQGLLKSVHEYLLPAYPELIFIVYDIGLTEKQVRRLRKYCRCEVRSFPFERFPPHVFHLQKYAFKPFIVNFVFQEFGSVWWLDATARFITKSLEKHLEYLKNNSQLFYTYGKALNVAIHTHPDTFEYFHEDPCTFENFGEIEAGNVAFVDTPSTRTILRNWVSCALIEKCFSPKGVSRSCPRSHTKKRIDNCHRFDQSVLSIMLRRLYHKQNNYPDWNPHYRVVTIQRGQSVYYFPES